MSGITARYIYSWYIYSFSCLLKYSQLVLSTIVHSHLFLSPFNRLLWATAGHSSPNIKPTFQRVLKKYDPLLLRIIHGIKIQQCFSKQGIEQNKRNKGTKTISTNSVAQGSDGTSQTQNSMMSCELLPQTEFPSCFQLPELTQCKKLWIQFSNIIWVTCNKSKQAST